MALVGIQYIYQQEKHLRQYIEKKIYQENFGYIMELIVAFLAIATTSMNVVLFYIEPEPGYWSKMFTRFDYAACIAFLIVYTLKLYVATHRMQYLFSLMSLLDLFTMLPTLILIEVSYENSFYFMIPFSRYVRSVTAFLIIQRYFKLG